MDSVGTMNTYGKDVKPWMTLSEILLRNHAHSVEVTLRLLDGKKIRGVLAKVCDDWLVLGDRDNIASGTWVRKDAIALWAVTGVRVHEGVGR